MRTSCPEPLRKSFPDFGAGDTINVHIKIREDNKENKEFNSFKALSCREKMFQGSNGETFTLRKISDSIAVEKIMPIFSPNIEKIEVIRKGKVRRARIFYLRKEKARVLRLKKKI